MLRRENDTPDCRSAALYSDCETYRYALSRRWNDDDGQLAFVMLNPSTATELRNDPTIERCERRARRLGFGGIEIVNLFAFRATLPADLHRADDPVGPENDAVLADHCVQARLVVAAWGVHGTLLGRGAQVARRLTCPLHHLGLTKDGHPRHPLYVPYTVHPQIWQATNTKA